MRAYIGSHDQHVVTLGVADRVVAPPAVHCDPERLTQHRGEAEVGRPAGRAGAAEDSLIYHCTASARACGDRRLRSHRSMAIPVSRTLGRGLDFLPAGSVARGEKKGPRGPSGYIVLSVYGRAATTVSQLRGHTVSSSSSNVSLSDSTRTSLAVSMGMPGSAPAMKSEKRLRSIQPCLVTSPG